MDEENIVRDLEVSDSTRTLKASYFVEHGVLHASIEGRVFRLPVGDDTSADAVHRLLVGNLQTRAWRKRMATHWRRPAPRIHLSVVVDPPTMDCPKTRADG
ncbi:MAG: hypothetical protein JWR51_520 [Devosia sp.]|jgi:hypothetical protein|uniref:hypothetical protein n=1 Tax=Devosia sp. TaxID=1871048 RepID=UPI00263790E3|nr:hypothetical protein [Devosia sp.]MDB5527417.1 hypothetical protein [Devosia sp.]